MNTRHGIVAAPLKRRSCSRFDPLVSSSSPSQQVERFQIGDVLGDEGRRQMATIVARADHGARTTCAEPLRRRRRAT